MNLSILRKLKKSCMAWVLGCAGFFLFNVPLHAAPQIQGYVMQVQLTPAVCALDSTKQKQRKCLEGYSLTITGLLPETTERNCSTNSSASLSPLQAKVVARVMPEENARVQLWRTVGGCVPMNAAQYFRTVINLADKLKVPTELTSAENKNVQHHALKSQIVRLNPGMNSESIRFTCQSYASNPVLTEVQVCYRVNGQYKQCSNHIVSNCPNTFSIKGTY
ncbi:ribonuclease T2 family protein [Acinetobacter sp. WCHAc060025]|uniref:ribonuclease T2 family protein n=1 Tax=Acinetobacter sp. WCHAc060025 TaxID=2518625 RepID=UPI0010230154|nr:ribonuclease I [Acinetobacter sp. WCHAc060025]RZG77996.1 ribonuclease I [Acinetobacter sp. WCHAc060025]